MEVQNINRELANGQYEIAYRIIFDDDNEAACLMRDMERCQKEFEDVYKGFTKLYDYFQTHLMKDEKFYDGKPNLLLNSSMITNVIICLFVASGAFAQLLEGICKLHEELKKGNLTLLNTNKALEKLAGKIQENS